MSQPRATLFLACCAALIAAAVLLGGGGSSALPEAARPAESPPPRPTDLLGVRVAVDASARRFLSAFLRYEVGDPDPAVARTLRATATPSFTAELLREPPRSSLARPSARPTLGPLSFSVVSAHPPLVSISGTAERPTGPEQLSFVFTRHHGRWLASGPGE